MRKLQFLLIVLFALTTMGFAVEVTLLPPDDETPPVIQTAIDGAADGDVIILEAGIYLERINMGGKAITLRSVDPTDAAVVASTIIDGEAGGSVIVCDSGEEPNTIISGLFIRNGRIFEDDKKGNGGGLLNVGASPTVTYCTFSGNIAEQWGGGMCNEDDTLENGDVGPLSIPTVLNCTFVGNKALFGGGIYNDYSDAVIDNCKFIENKARQGGGVHNYNYSDAMISNCTFSGNSVIQWGGGMCNEGYCDAIVSNCVFSGNECVIGHIGDAWNGGGIWNKRSKPKFINCTISGNHSDGLGGGMFNVDSDVTVNGTIIYGNSAVNDGHQVHNVEENDPIVTVAEFSYCNIEGGWNVGLGVDGGGNVDVDPNFVSDPNDGGDGWGDDATTSEVDEVANNDYGDLRLAAGSGCIDAGSNLLAPLDLADLDGDGLTTDWMLVDCDGNDRFADDPGTVDTGISMDDDVGVIDMGAYEFPGITKIAGDLTGDGQVDMDDLVVILGNWLVGVK